MTCLYDSSHSLSQESRRRIVEHIRAKKAILQCCEHPNWAPMEFVAAWPEVEEGGDKARMSIKRGVPVITIACESCGQLRNYHAWSIFPEWMTENASE